MLAVKGSTSAQNIREKAPDAEVLEFDNYQDAFTALKAGKGEALTTDNIILIGMQQTDNNYKLVGATSQASHMEWPSAKATLLL